MSPSGSLGPILVVDAEGGAEELSNCLAGAGYSVEVCHEGEAARRLLAEHSFGAVLCDPQAVEFHIDSVGRDVADAPAWIELAGFGSVEDAVEAVRRGAADYICKPFSDEQVLLAVARALEQRALRSENKSLKERLADRFGIGKLVTRDPVVHRILQSIEAVADTRATILIEGESGTGKTLLARTVHQLSGRRDGPFVEVNCGALPDTLLESELFGHVKGAFTGASRDKIGKFEAADHGTIFLDEIGTATPELQVKLLRVLQDRVFERLGDTQVRECDVRVIAATNAKLLEAVRAGTFREDLYWRLRVIAFELPPLRARPSDVALLAEQFVARFAAEHARGPKSLGPGALATLVAHTWPGNIRELEHAVERAVLLSRDSVITEADLGFEAAQPESAGNAVASDGTGESGAPYRPGTPLRTALEAPERAIIAAALRHSGGNRKEAARALDINRTTLFNKMRKYNLMEFQCDSE
ncbi:MAG: sigma-54-dependent Fis family transcriptional regulator [Planctomycetes bacterium]|nr:sigma-54-dependent Fis family transcriptional regulator [Planctomycetota bacterium]